MTDDKWNAQARKLALLGVYSQRCTAEALCAAHKAGKLEGMRGVGNFMGNATLSRDRIRLMISTRLDALKKVAACDELSDEQTIAGDETSALCPTG